LISSSQEKASMKIQLRKKKSTKDTIYTKPGRLYWLQASLLLLFFFFLLYQNSHTAKEISWHEFTSQILSKNAVEKIVVLNDQVATVYIRKELQQTPPFNQVLLDRKVVPMINPGPHYQFTIGSVDSFEHKMEEAQKKIPEAEQVPILYEKESSWLNAIFLSLLLLPVFFFLWLILLQKLGRLVGKDGNSSLFTFAKSPATLFDKASKSTITFDDVAGLDEAKTEIKELVNFLKSPQSYKRLGAQIPRGVILVGPPGTGKTLLVKAVAGEAQVPFFSISGSEFVEMFVGVGASRVRDLFRQAQEKTPCIVFIDEIDAIGRSRGRNAIFSGTNDERESTLNQLLTEMDGFGTNAGIIVIAATNRADILDPALLRPGRFDRHIYLELPNLIEREEIFHVHIKCLAVHPSVDTNFLASQTPGFSGADIANVCNESALIAARKNKKQIEITEFSEAIDRIIAGPEKKSKRMTNKEKKIIAFHEAGHALVSWRLEHADPLVKVSIVPRGKTLGASWYLPIERQIKTQPEYFDSLCVSLAGRAAEDIVFGELSSGALDDLEKVTKQAYNMVVYYGFDSKLGHISYFDSTGMEERTLSKPYSEETGKIIDQQVLGLIAKAYQETISLLMKEQEALKKIAQSLLRNEVLYNEDIELLLGHRPLFPTSMDSVLL